MHKTSRKKLKVKKQKAKTWIQENIRKPIKVIIKKLNIKLQGHYRYYGISDNISSMNNFRDYCIWELYRALRRLGQKSKMTVEKYKKILTYNEIARPKIYHSMWQWNKSERLIWGAVCLNWARTVLWGAKAWERRRKWKWKTLKALRLYTHTHTHTHTHTNSYSRVEFVYSTEQESRKNLFCLWCTKNRRNWKRV